MLDQLSEVFIINLESRTDRKIATEKELAKIGTKKYKFVKAVDGYTDKDCLGCYDQIEEDRVYWNPAAAGLIKTTINIVQEAIDRKLPQICILEDDVEFSDDLEKVMRRNWRNIPSDWHMVQLGCQHMVRPTPIGYGISRINAAFCLHAYFINHSIYNYYLEKMMEMDMQLDRITVDKIQPLKKCYCFDDNIAFQRDGFSNIQNQNVSKPYLRFQ